MGPRGLAGLWCERRRGSPEQGSWVPAAAQTSSQGTQVRALMSGSHGACLSDVPVVTLARCLPWERQAWEHLEGAAGQVSRLQLSRPCDFAKCEVLVPARASVFRHHRRAVAWGGPGTFQPVSRPGLFSSPRA